MKNLWSEKEAAPLRNNDLQLRVYTSRLIGREPSLVLHGGGNTSVKARAKDFFGRPVDLLYVKGSGWDLETIKAEGFSPVRIDALLQLSQLKHLTDADMVAVQRASMLDPSAPNPSIEAILHAVIPHKFVDHTHADAILTLTNTSRGEGLIREVLGDKVAILPYCMPGFLLAKQVNALIQKGGLEGVEALVLLKHGIFTFHESAKGSYERMIKWVSVAERHIRKKVKRKPAKVETPVSKIDLQQLAAVRKGVSRARGRAQLALLDHGPSALGLCRLSNAQSVVSRGTLTPDHVIRIKPFPMYLNGDIYRSLAVFGKKYEAYFKAHATRGHTQLDIAPRWALWKNTGSVSFGNNWKEAGTVRDIVSHTAEAMASAEVLGGWKPLAKKDLFEIEYWELEQAKLAKALEKKSLEGKVALVTGAAGGIGLACAQRLREEGAVVTGFDIDPKIKGTLSHKDFWGVVCDLTKAESVRRAVDSVVQRYGGLDILVSNAGIFTAGKNIEHLDLKTWERSLKINLTGAEQLLKFCIPYLKLGVDPAVVFVGSRNVSAPGAGAAAYSVAKAGLTQLCRVAALELGREGVRVNIIHPDAVFDTNLWTDEALRRSAERYGLSVEEYKTRNVMKTTITSRNVAEVVAALAGPVFAKTTGAQIPVDGGNERVI